MNEFGSALKNKIDSMNENIYKNNLKKIEEYADVCKKKLSAQDLHKVKSDLINSADSYFIISDINQKFL